MKSRARPRPHRHLLLLPLLSFSLLSSLPFAMNPNWNQRGYQQPQQTGYQQPLYGQPTGVPQQQGWQQQPQQQQQQRPPPPPIPSASYSFLSAPPTQSQFPGGGMGISPQATGWQQPGQQGGLQPQATGWAGAGMGGGSMLQAQRTGFQAPLVPQTTGFHDPRVQMMTSSFMPQNISSVSPQNPLLSFPPFSELARWERS